MPAKTNAQVQREFQSRKRADMGEVAYKALQAAQRKQRRSNQQQRPTTAPAPAPAPAETPAVPAVQGVKKSYTMYNKTAPTPATLTLDDIYKLKSEQSVAKNKTIKLATVAEQYKNILNLHKKIFNSEFVSFEFLKDTNQVLNFINSNESWKQSTKDKNIQSISSILSVVPGFKKEYKIYSDISTKNSKDYVERAGDIVNVEQFVDWDEVKNLWNKGYSIAYNNTHD